MTLIVIFLILCWAILKISCEDWTFGSSYDQLLYNFTNIWQREFGEYYAIRSINGKNTRYLIKDNNQLSYFCWIPHERKYDYEVDILPLSSELINVGSIKSVYNDTHIRTLSTLQNFVVSDHQVNFAKQNTAIVKWSNISLVTWRLASKNRQDRTVYVIADEKDSINYTIIQEPSFIHVQYHDEYHPLLGEDMRLFVSSSGKLYANWCVHHIDSIWMKYSELLMDWKDGKHFLYAKSPTRILRRHHEIYNSANKNWAMFEYGRNGTLYFVNSIQPFRVMIPLQKYKLSPMIHGTEEDIEYFRGSEYLMHTVSFSMIKDFCWNYGNIHGGTPALLVGDEYLAFFHSAMGVHYYKTITYWIGAYTFSKEPPFRITAMSKVPIVSPVYYEGWTYKSLDYDIFPMSFSFDNHFIYLVYGKNEREGWITKFNRSGLFKSLRSVQSVVLGDCAWDADTLYPDVGSFAYLKDENNLCNGHCESL